MTAVDEPLVELTAPVGRVWPADPVAAAALIGAEVAAVHAAAVDREGRFPTETVTAMGEAGLLSLLIPEALGGTATDPVAALAQAMAAVGEIGRYCSSSGMTLAMHLIQVACLVRHGDTPELRSLTAEVAARPLLLASATTEAGVGGDVRTSRCSVVARDGGYSLSKQAMVISYGEQAHGVLATARRDPDAAASDQVLVACLPPGLTLTPIGDWNVLGFRGTRSLGFQLDASGPTGLVFPDPYTAISSHTMLPVAHLLWSSLWAAMAGAAVDKAAAYVRAGARANPAKAATDLRLATLVIRQQQLRALVSDGAARYAQAQHDQQATAAIGFSLVLNGLKVAASTEVAEIVSDALRICGMAGYREDGPYSMGRLLRDAHGAALMVSNDRILRNDAELLLVHKGGQ